MNGMLEALFIEIVGSILVDTGRKGLVGIFNKPPARIAVSDTAADFPHILAVQDSLTKWCKSEEFISELEALQAGHDEPAYDRLVDSFIDVGGFSDGLTNTHASATQVLNAFFKHLEEELLKTELAEIIAARRAKLRHQATQASLTDLGQQLQSMPAVLDAIIRQHLPPVDPETIPAVQEKIHFAAVDLAVDLLKEGKPESARRRLAALREKLAKETPSVDLLFRITANLGSCALQLDDHKTAEREYEAALRLKPDHSLVLSYAALVAMIMDDSERALEYATRSRPAGERNPHITSTYLRVLHHVGRSDEIERLLREEEWIERDPLCALALGLIRLAEENHGQAEAHFRTALQGEVKNAHVHRLLAQTIIIPIDQILQTDPPLQLSEEILARVREAEDHLTRAVEIFEKYENPSGLYEALLQRAYVRGLQGQPYAALGDCDRLLVSHPNDAKALYQKGHTLLFAGKPDEALECFSRIQNEEERTAAVLSVALAHHRSQRHEKVIETLAECWRPAELTRRQTIVADLLLMAYHHTGNTERVGAIVSDLERERADDPEALIVRARHHMRAGQQEEARVLYRRAVELASPGNQKWRITDEFADYYFDEGDWAAAVGLYKETVDKSDDNARTRRYLTALYNSGARRAALKLAREMRGGGKAIPFVSEIEAGVLVAAGEFENALRLFSELAKLEPQKISHRLWMVDIQHRLKNDEGARQTLEGITLDELKNDSTALIQVAMLRQKLELGGDLPFAYRARQLSFNDADVHRAYVQLFMDHTRRERGDLDVNGVADDFAVHLENPKGEKKTYLIVEQDEYDLHQGEISPTDPRALEMLGKRAGNTVIFNQGRADEVQYEIVDIQSKYVYAFQQTIKKHTEWFGGTDGMMVMDVAEGDFSKFFRMIDQQHERQQQTAELYRERRLPLAMAASLKGANVFETWAGLVNSNDMRLHMTTGDISELQRSMEIVRLSNAVVVEMSALFTLCALDLLDKLTKVFSRIVVAQVVLDKLEKWLNEAERRSPYMTIRPERGQYIREDITEEMIARSKDFLSRIKRFVESNAELVAAVKALDIPSDQLETYEEALGVSAASVFVASELKLPLYMDDVGLTQFAASPDWQVQGVSTIAVLAKMKGRGLLSAFDHCMALKTLILGNYIVVHVNTQQLWWMCQSEGWKATSRMKRILRLTLQGPEWEERAAVEVAAQFTHRMWLEVRELYDRLELVDSVVEAVVSGREEMRVKGLLKSQLSKTFTHLPSALPLIYSRIDAFAASRGDSAEDAGGHTARAAATAP